MYRYIPSGKKGGEGLTKKIILFALESGLKIVCTKNLLRFKSLKACAQCDIKAYQYLTVQTCNWASYHNLNDLAFLYKTGKYIASFHSTFGLERNTLSFNFLSVTTSFLTRYEHSYVHLPVFLWQAKIKNVRIELNCQEGHFHGVPSFIHFYICQCKCKDKKKVYLMKLMLTLLPNKSLQTKKTKGKSSAMTSVFHLRSSCVHVDCRESWWSSPILCCYHQSGRPHDQNLFFYCWNKWCR